MHIRDQTEADFVTKKKCNLLAVGWLEAGHDYSLGTPKDEFFLALMSLARNPWQPVHSAGRHECSLCQFTGGPSVVRYRNMEVFIGSTNIFVPTDDRVYVAPSSIVHYIDAHDYCPPTEFQDAVIECPEMRSMAYLKLIAKHGVQKNFDIDGN